MLFKRPGKGLQWGFANTTRVKWLFVSMSCKSGEILINPLLPGFNTPLHKCRGKFLAHPDIQEHTTLLDGLVV